LKSKLHKIIKSHFFGFLALTLVCIHISSAAEEPTRIALLPFKINAEKDLSYVRNGIFDMLVSRLSQPGKVEVFDRKQAEEALAAAIGAEPINESTARIIGERLNADFVLFGSLTVLGNNISIDANMVDVSGTRPPMTFFDQSQDLGGVITKVNQIAADINANLFGQVTVAKQVPAQPQASQPVQPQAPQADKLDIHAHPEKLLESGRPDEEGELLSGEGQIIHQQFWRSASFGHLINGVALGDVDGDKKIGTVIITPHSVLIYRFENGRFLKIHQLAESRGKYFIGVDVADINGNDVEEIFVTSLNNRKTQVLSFVLESNGKNYSKIVENSPWLYRVADLAARGKILLGQRPKVNKPYSGTIFEMTWQNSAYEPENEIKTPRETSLIGFTLGDVLNNNQQAAVSYKTNDRICIIDLSGKVIWEGSERYGGSMVYYAGPKIDGKGGARVENRLYFPMRLVVMKNKNNGNEVIAVKNYELVGHTLEFRKFTQAHIESFAWDGLGLAPKWRTRKISGHIRDYAVGDFNNDGKIELIGAVVQKEGRVALVTSSKSVIIAFELS
jgi:TolB-like protein